MKNVHQIKAIFGARTAAVVMCHARNNSFLPGRPHGLMTEVLICSLNISDFEHSS